MPICNRNTFACSFALLSATSMLRKSDESTNSAPLDVDDDELVDREKVGQQPLQLKGRCHVVSPLECYDARVGPGVRDFDG